MVPEKMPDFGSKYYLLDIFGEGEVRIYGKNHSLKEYPQRIFTLVEVKNNMTVVIESDLQPGSDFSDIYCVYNKQEELITRQLGK